MKAYVFEWRKYFSKPALDILSAQETDLRSWAAINNW